MGGHRATGFEMPLCRDTLDESEIGYPTADANPGTKHAAQPRHALSIQRYNMSINAQVGQLRSEQSIIPIIPVRIVVTVDPCKLGGLRS